MNNLYRFFAIMALAMAWMMPAQAQHPFVLTTQDDVTNHTEKLYWIESKGATGFYMIPMGFGNDSGVSTSNMPNERMLWYFMDAGIENSTQYYYIVNKYTDRFLRLKGDNGADGSIGIKEYVANDIDTYKFSITAGTYQWVIHPYSSSSHTVNKQGTSVNYAKGLKSSTANGTDSSSNWSFVAKDDVAWAHPFDNSTSNVKHYYLIQNRHKDYTSFYMSTDASSYVTVSTVGDNNRIWYFEEASSDASIPNMKYYYIVNAVTGKYMYYDGNYSGTSQNNIFKIQNRSGGDDDRYQFAIVNAVGGSYSAFAIMPKILIGLYQDMYTSLGSGTMNDGERIDKRKDRGSDNNDAHWVFATTTYSAVAAPTITNNFDGTITLSTTTTGATIYYTTNGDEPDNNSTEYTSPFALGDATVIKAVAYLGANFAIADPYTVPTYTTPTISFDDNTSQVTITSEGTVYYNTGDGSQAAPTPSSGTLYNEPFTVSSDITVKAIATHPGYLNSDVAIWPTDPAHDYSADYLTFKVLTGGTICWKAFGSGFTRTIEYSKNDGSWTSITSTSSGVTIDVIANDVVRFRGSNNTYAGSKSNYSGFEGGTASFDIEGNIHSLLYGDSFANGNNNSLTNSTYQFCSLFKKALVVSAENLVLPATTLKNYCYRALFSWCETLEKAPSLPATTLAKGCYWYMFEQCDIEEAPDLMATTLVDECYGHMFEGCASLNYVKCMATDKSATSCTADWLKDVSSTGTFVKESNTAWSSGASGIPSHWTIYDEFLLYSPEIDCDGQYITITCATEGASILYRLNETGDFLPYSSPIAVSTTTTVEAYSTKDNNTSNIVTYTFEIFDNPFEESTRPVNSWTYGGTQVTLPYSVNRLDGHSPRYSKGTHAFETTITLYKQQPTRLWFQHADQSADIYVNNEKVTTHWGGYNAFFVDITNKVHVGTNHIKVILNNTTRDELAPAGGDFNFNATLGKVVLLTSPVMPSEDYGYDGFHITATNVSSTSATLTVKTKIPEGASVECTISDGTYNWTKTQPSTGDVQTFTTTISNPHLWNGTIDPHLYTVTLEIYKDNELYHRYQRPYGIRYYDYVIGENGGYTGFRLNGSPYLLRGVCMHDDLEGKANALNDEDYALEFNIIQDLGCNFVRLAHYPHPKEVYDWCDSHGIIVQTEVPCVNKFQSTMPDAYYTHLVGQYDDMVRQHYNHPCILFWGLGNEIVTDNASAAKTRLEGYRTQIKALDPERWVGYVVSHSFEDPSGVFNNPEMDWFGCNIYVGWYLDTNSNNPSPRLNTRLNNTIYKPSIKKPLAFSEYGCGGTQHCHSDRTDLTTIKGNYARHDIEYQMWLHEGHIAAIKSKPELLFTSQWQLFDIAVSSRNEGFTECLDGMAFSTKDDLRYLNNKGLVERDHVTKKDTYYLYKAWWNQTDKFVHICGKDYEKITHRVIKCYTNDGIITNNATNDTILNLFVNNVLVESAVVHNNIATFTARDFAKNNVIRVVGATKEDTFTMPDGIVYDHFFQAEGNWNDPTKWKDGEMPTSASKVLIKANATIPSGTVAQADVVFVDSDGFLTIEEGGQLDCNYTGTAAVVKKNIDAHGATVADGGWNFIATPMAGEKPATTVANLLSNNAANYDLFYYDEAKHYWRNYKSASPKYKLNGGQGYLYANNANVELQFVGPLQAGTNGAFTRDLSYACDNANLKGFNLVGNPFACNATIKDGNGDPMSFYVINGARVVANTGSTIIPPCTGVMVKATASDQSVTFTKATAQPNAQPSQLQLTLAQQEIHRDGVVSTPLDNAIVSFDEDSQLGKFYFGEQNANIYLPQGGEEYAIVSVGRDGVHTVSAVDVNFKANKNGTYTIAVDPEGVELSYLHLIDHLTGADVDLLNPNDGDAKQGDAKIDSVESSICVSTTYTFDAKTTDYESRFRLVFACGDTADDEAPFAFVNNGNIVVTADVEDATLQVIDVMGRIIVSREGVHTVSTTGMTPGVYVLRLVNGDKARTQKIVVR